MKYIVAVNYSRKYRTYEEVPTKKEVDKLVREVRKKGKEVHVYKLV